MPQIMNNIFHFIVFVLLGILIGRESVRFEQPRFEELIKSIRENPINIKVTPVIPIPVPVRPEAPPSSYRAIDKLTELNGEIEATTARISSTVKRAGYEPYLQSSY